MTDALYNADQRFVKNDKTFVFLKIIKLFLILRLRSCSARTYYNHKLVLAMIFIKTLLNTKKKKADLQVKIF